MLDVALICLGAGALSWWGTDRYRRYALERRILDIPTERSSHVQPTPRGGGVAIVAASLAALLALGFFGRASWAELTAFAGGGMIAAAIGFVDDRRSLSPYWRLVGHFSAAAWVVVWLRLAAGDFAFPLTDPFIQLGVAGDVLVLLFIVWMLNLTNFMDGIDGLAGSEVVTVATAGSGIALALGSNGVAPSASGAAVSALVIAAATAGFLLWNWPPARIFMGDAGSGYLGLLLAALALRAGQSTLALFWAWGILLGVFVVDATVTLFRRLARGDRVYEAHRNHAYQHAARRMGSHRAVTLAAAGINVVWLLPIAGLVAAEILHPAVGFAIAYTPLVVVAIAFSAGAAPAGPARGPDSEPTR